MASKPKPRSVADFRASHDRDVIVPTKIRAALEAIQKIGPEHYEYEGDFIKLAGISQVDIGKYREQFQDFIVDAPTGHGKSQTKRAYFGSTKVAKKLRGE
jgi:ribulose bisphosphate carboxylase small subunit